jgi:hypothetical protein
MSEFGYPELFIEVPVLFANEDCPAPISFIPESNFGEDSMRITVIIDCRCDECRCEECGGSLLEERG